MRSWDRTAGIEQLGQDNQDKTSIQDRTARTGKLGQESQKDSQDKRLDSLDR